MSAFIASTQRTNALGSLGNGRLAATRWTITPCWSASARQAAAAARQHVHLDAVARPGARTACGRGGRGRPRSPAGTPRRPAGRACAGPGTLPSAERIMTPLRVVMGPQGSITPIARAPDPIDPGVRIGHTHLRTADIDRIRDFYVGVLGFDVISEARDVPGWGTTGDILFLSAGGYHHHLGFNTWKSKGGPPSPTGSPGCTTWRIAYPTRRGAGRRLPAAESGRLADPPAHRSRHARGDLHRRSRRQHARADVGPAARAVAARRRGPPRGPVRPGPRPRRPAARARLTRAALEALEHGDPELADESCTASGSRTSAPRRAARRATVRGALRSVPSTGPLRTATSHEHLAAAQERARRAAGVERLVGAGERLGPARAQPEQAQRSRTASGSRRPARAPPISRRSIAWRQSKSTGRRLSGSTSARNASSSPW